MMCTECDFRTDLWTDMKSHYRKKHPKTKHPSKYFTREAKLKI